MTNSIVPTERSGHSDALAGTERTHTLILYVNDRPGALDRVVGVLRRRRANTQTLVIGRCDQPEIMRVTVVVKDAEVTVEHLVEQLRKVIDIQQLENLTDQQEIVRELALIKVNCTAVNYNEIIEVGHLFRASAVAIGHDTVTLEVADTEEKVDKLISMLQEYGIREVARSGRVAISRPTMESTVVEKENKE